MVTFGAELRSWETVRRAYDWQEAIYVQQCTHVERREQTHNVVGICAIEDIWLVADRHRA